MSTNLDWKWLDKNNPCPKQKTENQCSGNNKCSWKRKTKEDRRVQKKAYCSSKPYEYNYLMSKAQARNKVLENQQNIDNILKAVYDPIENKIRWYPATLEDFDLTTTKVIMVQKPSTIIGEMKEMKEGKGLERFYDYSSCFRSGDAAIKQRDEALRRILQEYQNYGYDINEQLLQELNLYHVSQTVNCQTLNYLYDWLEKVVKGNQRPDASNLLKFLQKNPSELIKGRPWSNLLNLLSTPPPISRYDSYEFNDYYDYFN